MSPIIKESVRKYIKNLLSLGSKGHISRTLEVLLFEKIKDKDNIEQIDDLLELYKSLTLSQEKEIQRHKAN